MALPKNPPNAILRRLPAGRKANLAAYVFEIGQVTVNELAEYFDVSSDTIRRDLNHLDAEKIIIRTHGGAISPRLVPRPDTNLDVRLSVRKAEKRIIGELAVSLVKDNSVVILNAGTTILEVARHLRSHTGLIIATNNLELPREIAPSAYRALYIFGGSVMHSSRATIGPVSFQTIGGGDINIRCNLALIAVGGVSVDGGFSISNLNEASMLKEMILKAEKVAILADSSKFNNHLFAQIAELGRINYFVSDKIPPREIMDIFKKNNVQVLAPNI